MPEFSSIEELDGFLFPAEDERITAALTKAFSLKNAGGMVTVAVRASPAYAARVAKTVPRIEMRSQYADLARYLHLYGPCQKSQTEAPAGGPPIPINRTGHTAERWQSCWLGTCSGPNSTIVGSSQPER